jgi:hypothetical protein
MQFHVIVPVCASDAERSAREVITRQVISVVSPLPLMLSCQPGAVEPETIAALSEAFRAPRQLHATGQHEVVREVIARRIVIATSLVCAIRFAYSRACCAIRFEARAPPS